MRNGAATACVVGLGRSANTPTLTGGVAFLAEVGHDEAERAAEERRLVIAHTVDQLGLADDATGLRVGLLIVPIAGVVIALCAATLPTRRISAGRPARS